MEILTYFTVREFLRGALSFANLNLASDGSGECVGSSGEAAAVGGLGGLFAGVSVGVAEAERRMIYPL